MSNLIKRLFIALALTGLLTSCAAPAATVHPTVEPTATSAPTMIPAPTLPSGDSERIVTVNGQERTYFLHIPPGLDKNHVVPLVLAFHEYYTEVSDFAPSTDFNSIADINSFLVAYPAGLGNSWNAGGCCGYAVEKNIDDIAFVRQILSDMGTVAGLDPKRIYAAGFSNGASLSYRLACEMSDTFAAIATVSGPLSYSPCEPKQPVSVIHVHGLADAAVPYSGGTGNVLATVVFPPVEQGIATWVELDGCASSPQVEKQSDVITRTAYSACNAGTAVELYTIGPGGHAWPSKYVWPASEAIWEFFAAHPKP